VLLEIVFVVGGDPVETFGDYEELFLYVGRDLVEVKLVKGDAEIETWRGEEGA
jgi:hypothetical protein